MAILWALFVFGKPVSPGMFDGVPRGESKSVSSVSPLFHHSISRGIDLVFSERYQESLRIFERLERKYPDHPAPYFFKAAAYQNWMSSFRTKQFQNELERNVHLAIDSGNKLLEKRNDPWLHFYVGAAYGYRAYNRFSEHDWIGAYLDGWRGVKHLEEALDKDPNLYDVYLGLGSYHYWRTAKSKFIRVIAFWVPDRRELGLRQLEFALEHGMYASSQAGYTLIVAYFDYGAYEKALSIVNRNMGGKHPPSLSDLYYKGRLLAKLGRWAEAESLFRELLGRLESQELASVGYKVESQYWLALALKTQDRVSEALRFTREALNQCEKRKTDRELEGPFENFEEIRTQLRELHEQMVLTESVGILAAGRHPF